VDPLPFSHLLYRYFFFQWLFRPPLGADSSLFERKAVERHNRRQAAWLPVYMLRWFACAGIFYLLGQFMHLAQGLPLLQQLCFLLSAVCAAFACSIATAWVGLRHLVDG
jgi:hypothetical protein